MIIGGQTFTVRQNGSGSTTCSCTISPTNSPRFSTSPTRTPFGSTGNTGTVAVSSNCSWSATSNVPWIKITAGGLGNGDGMVSYFVSANSGGPRTGTITIGGQTFTVTQNGSTPCTFDISPSVYPVFNASSNTGAIHVTPSSRSCSWTASSSVPWITITSGNGSGDGNVTFALAANTGAQRTGTITIGDKTSTITQANPRTPLYFPHVDTSLPWQTEIAVINTSDKTVTGSLKAFDDEGGLVETRDVILSPRGRKQMIVSDVFTNHTNIGYIVYETDSDAAVQGYTKLYQTGSYRTAIPAVKETNTANIYISHIASDAQWWTAVSLVNTTSAAKELIITFNNGQSSTIRLAANEHKVFTIASLFNNQPQPNIRSAVITNASGVIGMEIFGNTVGGNRMDGILLTDKTASTLYYPHVAGREWWTGIVAYNPSALPCEVAITPYSAQGTPLTPSTLQIAGKGKYIGEVAALGLPTQTAWFRIDSTRPLSGFELFGTVDGSQLAAYAEAGGTGAKSGVFAKIERSGWTGIAFVNTEAGHASVTLTAYNNNGTAVATSVLPVGGYAKVVNLAEAIFTQDTSSATYIAYSSDRNVVGFQLNGSADWDMLDALPGM